MTLLVTGGAGFIGSALVRHLLKASDEPIIVIDKMTYAAHPASLAALAGQSRLRLEKVDICDAAGLARLFELYDPDGVFHLAAETHVDRSIDGPFPFVQTNVTGTCTLLQAAVEHWRKLKGSRQGNFRFLHVSTDEVYGSLGETELFSESSPYRPNSPYAASKAASDHFARAWQRTYSLPVLITNCSNNYGPYQFPEKLIPLMIISALNGQPLPVYGEGKNIRDWIYVEDHAAALWQAFRHGRVGECYNIGGLCERSNLELVRELCAILDQRVPKTNGASHADRITFVTDRPGHDFRYALDCSKMKTELGWEPQENLSSGLVKTVDWYLANRNWWRAIQEQTYKGERLGLIARVS